MSASTFVVYNELLSSWEDCPIDMANEYIMPMLLEKKEFDEEMAHPPISECVLLEWEDCPIEVIEESILPFVCPKKYICLPIESIIPMEDDIDKYENTVTSCGIFVHNEKRQGKVFEFSFGQSLYYPYIKLKRKDGSGYLLFGQAVIERELPDGTEIIIVLRYNNSHQIYVFTDENGFSHDLRSIRVQSITDDAIHFTSGNGLKMTDRKKIYVGFYDWSYTIMN